MARPGAKKITTWRYNDGNGTELSIPVTMHTEGHGASARNSFSVSIPEMEIRARNADINALQKEVYALVKERSLLVWAPFLYVGFEQDADDFGGLLPTAPRPKVDASLRITVHLVETTERPDGTLMSRGREYGGGGSRPYEGLPEVGPGDEYERKSMRAMVPDTPENRRALYQFCQGVATLGRRLSELLEPEVIGDTLAQVLALKGLPDLSGPAPAKPARSTKKGARKS